MNCLAIITSLNKTTKKMTADSCSRWPHTDIVSTLMCPIDEKYMKQPKPVLIKPKISIGIQS